MSSFCNNIVFCGLMDDRDFCKEILEVLFPITIKNLEVERFFDGRFGDGIRCFVVVEESSDVLEILIHNRLKKNTIFFSDDFKSNKKTENFIHHEIFLCHNDPFGFVVPAYALDDRIIFNSGAWEYCKIDKLANFLRYLNEGVFSDPFTEWLNCRVKEFLALGECTREKELLWWKKKYKNISDSFCVS